MNIRNELKKIITKLLENIHEWRKMVLALSCLVVFITTYILILPAFTLDKEEAADQGGIDVSAIEQSIGEDTDPAIAGPEEKEAVETASNSVEQSIGEDADPAIAGPEEKEAVETASNSVAKSDSAEDVKPASGGNSSTEITLQNDESDDFIVAIEAKDAGISEDVSVEVREIVQNDKEQKEEYESLYNDALEAVQKAQAEEGLDKPSDFAFAKFYDISLMDGNDEVKPDSEVDVKISFSKDLQKELKVADPDKVHIIHFAEDKETGEVTPEVLDADNTDITVEKNKVTEATFTADSFSVFALVYTVDFHWKADGETYDFSLPGGGCVTLSSLIRKLDIDTTDADGNSDDKQFLDAVESVEFSDPNLVWVGKVNEDTTVGGIKEANKLHIEYSADLSDEQIAEINEKTVRAGDWALISMLPFQSEEALTITMKNGDKFVVKVTDYQPAATNMSQFETGNTNRFVIWGVGSDGNSYVLKTDGTTERFNPNDIDTLGADYLWTIEYGWNQGWDYGMGQYDYRYYIRPANDPTKCLALNNGYITSENLVQTESSGTHLYPPYSRHKNQDDNNYTSNNSGWILEGWGWTRLNLGNSSHQFEGNQHYCSDINISRVQTPYNFDIIVKTDDYERGGVSGYDKNGTNRQVEETFTATTYASSGINKTNLREIKAVPQTQKWAFDHWELDGKTLYWDRNQNKIVFEENQFTEVYTNLNASRESVINAGSLPVTFNESTLTAFFKRNPDYEAPDDDKDGRPIDETIEEWLEDLLDAEFPLNKEVTQKTAEVYDYENRIYRVDITTASNLYALDKNVKLGFVLDVSASMKFPSKLNMVSSSDNTQTTGDPARQLSLQLNRINDNNYTKRWLDQSKTYYIIADKANTATVDKIFYQGNSWRFTDASKNGNTVIDSNTKFHNSDSVGLTYPIYLAGDPIEAADFDSPEGNLLRTLGLQTGDPRPRAFYLQRSMRETTAELQQIMTKISVANNPSQASEVLIAWNTFCGSVNNSDHTFKAPGNVSFSYTYDGGTSTQLALNDAQDFGWGSDNNTSRFAILITDGAPQKSSVAIDNDVVAAQARALKTRNTSSTADDITLITLGLSMGDVRRGEILLYDIASRDQENVPYYYEAESGNELELALAEVIRLAMANAIVEGNITDTINEAFYPVDKGSGLPLEDGSVINLNGEWIASRESALTPEQRSAGYGVISESDGTYSVTWTGQEFTWEGWHGTIYEKAKEDFLGGNAVRTNDPAHPAVVTSNGYKLHPGDNAIPFKQSIKDKGTKSLETPRVNVNELQITNNSTEWTVYLGASVNPREQIEALYNDIKIQQVITKGTDTDHDGFKDKELFDGETWPLYYELAESASDARENETDGQQEYFYLKDLIKKLNGGNDIDWDRLIDLSEETGDDNTGITFPYDLYGQDNPGWITIKLEKDHSVDPHATEQVGDQVETYTLKVLFSPLYDHIPVGQGGDGSYPYHTGSYGLGTYGNAAGTEEEENKHIINVFAKKLKIEKVDQSQELITGDENAKAVFGLYRKATAAEIENEAIEKKTLNGVSDPCVLVTNLTTEDGVATTDLLPLLKGTENYDEPYYLVEEDAPDGYNLLTDVLKVTIDMSKTTELDQNVWTKHSDSTVKSNTKPTPYDTPYDWVQKATIKVTDLSGQDSQYAVRVNDGEHEAVIYNSETDTTDASVTYKIINSAGVELPHTGGIGTTIFYILGSILVIGGAIYFVSRRRMK